MQLRARTLVVVLSLAFVAAACGGEPASTTDPGSGEPSTSPGGGSSQARPATPSPTGAAQIPEILDFEAPLLGGGTLRGVDYAGKDVAFWFWAPW